VSLEDVAQNGGAVKHAPRRNSEFLRCRRSGLTAAVVLLLCFAGSLWAAADDKPAQKDVVYQPGGEVKSPKLIHYVEPAFSSSSKEAFVEGVVRISTVVKSDGVPSDIHVSKGLNSEEDQKAVDAVGKWRFQPGTKNGQPVNVRVTVEVEFHLL
jgi:TonB family protein